MALSADEERNLRDVLALFFPEDKGACAAAEFNDETLEQTEIMIIGINS